MKPIDKLKQIIKEEIQRVLTENSGIPEYFYPDPNNRNINYKIHIDDEGNKYIIVNNTVIDIQDPMGRQKVLAQIKSASKDHNRQSEKDYRLSMDPTSSPRRGRWR